jgi:hypothetical protein
MRNPKQKRNKVGIVADELSDIGDLIDLNYEPETAGEYSLALRELVVVPTSGGLGSQQSPVPRGGEDGNLLGQHHESSAEQPRRLTSILEIMDTPFQQGIAVKGCGIITLSAGATRDSTQPSTISFPKLREDPPLEGTSARGHLQNSTAEETVQRNLREPMISSRASNLTQNRSTEDEEAFRLLLKNGFDINTSYNKRESLLWAANNGHEAAVRLLL